MRLPLLTVLVGAFAPTAIRPALGQCPVLSLNQGVGAVDRGRAIVTDYEPGVPAHVHFYEKTDQGWQPGDMFVVGDVVIVYRVTLDIDGNRAIAGSAESTGSDVLSGRAFVFDRVGDHWVPTELVSATNGEGGYFGATVALSGNVAVVGALHETKTGGDGLARAHVFEFDGTHWTEVAQLTSYRYSVDVEGDTIVLGDDRVIGGRVNVYRSISGLWTWTQSLFVPTPPGGPYLGSSVALQGDTLVAGASWPFQSVAGFVEVFRRQGDFFQPVQHIVPADSAPGDEFGASVALSGPTLLVGAPLSDSVHRFDHDGASFVEADGFDPVLPINNLGWPISVHREDAFIGGVFQGAFFRLGFSEVESFCPTTPNSTGAPGSLAALGCDSLSGQRLTLVASHLPPGVVARSFFGASTTQVPFGDGFRCVAAPLFRLPAGVSDASGHWVDDVDFSSGAASHLTVGGTSHFQTLYRDPGPGARLNLTNALSIGITP